MRFDGIPEEHVRRVMREGKVYRYMYWFNGKWMTRQRVWQLKRIAEGRCQSCGVFSIGHAGVLCMKCGIKRREYMHRKLGCKRKNHCKTRLFEYRLEDEQAK